MNRKHGCLTQVVDGSASAFTDEQLEAIHVFHKDRVRVVTGGVDLWLTNVVSVGEVLPDVLAGIDSD